MNVSLILCTRNRRDILIHNLELFIDQFNIGDEIIIVDSSDRPRAIGREDFGEVKPNIRYFHTLPGLPLQRNYGIAKATCDLVMFLDDDIYLFPASLEKMRLFFMKRPEIDAITGALSERVLPSTFTRRLQYVFGKLFFTSYFGKMSLTLGGLPILALDSYKEHPASFLRGGFSVYRRYVFADICYDEYFKDYAYLEDTDFSLQFNKKFKACFFDGFKGFHAHVSTIQKDQSNYRRQYVVNYVHIYRKHRLGSSLKMNWVLLGLLLLNLIKSCLEKNFSFFKGTLAGIEQVYKNK